MDIQNKIQINDVSQFSDINEVTLATVGRFGKYQDRTYRITIIKDVVFIHTWGETQTIELLSHYPFKFVDGDGEHTVDENTKSITVKGITNLTFVYK